MYCRGPKLLPPPPAPFPNSSLSLCCIYVLQQNAVVSNRSPVFSVFRVMFGYLFGFSIFSGCCHGRGSLLLLIFFLRFCIKCAVVVCFMVLFSAFRSIRACFYCLFCLEPKVFMQICIFTFFFWFHEEEILLIQNM